MPGDASDRTEAPTPRRRTEAREHGQVARSTDLSGALLLLGGMVCLRWFAPGMFASLMKVMKDGLSLGGPTGWARLDLAAVVSSVGVLMLAAAGPILVGLVVVGVCSNLLQVGFLFTTHPLQLKLDRLNPSNGVKRLFTTRTLVQLFMNVLKLTVVTAAAYSVVADRKGQILLALDIGPWQQIVVLSNVLYDVGLRLAAVLLVLALIDYLWHRYKHEQDLKMTREEVKEELRRMEGDPIVRQRRRRMQFAAAMQRIKSTVPKADVVVTNPTEFAVALKYDVEEMRAPTVVAKGRNLLAQRIREIAIASGVPIVERPPLARALFKMVQVGQEIPEQFYKAVAEVLAYVYELSGRGLGKKVAAA
jgi:flagellar biosynthetic protein FlhB